jgi:hypothetical protein
MICLRIYGPGEHDEFKPVVFFLIPDLMEQWTHVEHARMCYIFLVMICTLRCLSMMHSLIVLLCAPL